MLHNFAFCGSLVDLTASSSLLLHICCGLVRCNSSVLAWRENLICAGALQGMQAFALLPLLTSVLLGSQHRLHFLALWTTSMTVSSNPGCRYVWPFCDL